MSVPAPAPVVTQSCWMEQETIWDTQYVDQVTMECNEIVKVDIESILSLLITKYFLI